MQAYVCILISVVIVAPSLVFGAPAPAREESSTDGWLAEMEAYFAQNPELMQRRGSGWKPFQRLKWYVEPRLPREAPGTAGARWEAWLTKNERENRVGFAPRASWFCLGPVNVAGRCNDIEFHPTNPDIVYVGSASGGVWKSTDGGDTWTPITDDLPALGVGAVLVLPWSPDVVLLGTGEGTWNMGRVGGVGVLKSTDAGASWNPTGLSYPIMGIVGHGFHVMEANPLTGTILAGATDGLWRSTDEGETWTQVKEGGDYYDVKWKPGDANRVYTVKGRDDVGNNVKVSTDDGLTWAKAGSGQPASMQIGKSKLAVTPAAPTTVYVLYSTREGATTGLYGSTDDGATWEVRCGSSSNLVGGQGWYNLVLAADPDDAERLIAGGVYLHVSTNGGVDFTETGEGNILGEETMLHVDHHALTYEPGSTTNVWVATDGGVWRSTDDGETWSSQREGLVTYQFYDICVAQSDTDFLMGGTQDNGVPGRESVNTWFPSTLIADGMVCNIDPTAASVVYAEWQFGNQVKSLDGGQTWFEIMNGIQGGGTWVTPVDEDRNQPDHLYTMTGQGIYRTTQGGDLWENVAPHTAVWISISPVDGDVVWTLNGGGVQLTTDDGDSWTSAAAYGFATGSPTKILAHPTSASTAFVTFSGYDEGLAHVVLTTDAGASWEDVTGDFPDEPVNAIVVDPQSPTHWYIGTDVGVWASTNGGTNWIPYEVALPNAVVVDLEIRDSARKLVAGTHGRGAWEVDITPPLSTEAGAIAVAPAALDLMLDPPLPNPVRGRAHLRFAAKHQGAVTLDIYDVRGRLVSRVAELPRGDGIIRVTSWLTDDVANGVYFAVLRAGEERVSRKLVVAK
jgi:hypothetical protein